VLILPGTSLSDPMDWQVHYQSGGREFRAAAADKQTAICVACILLRDGHDVMKVESRRAK